MVFDDKILLNAYTELAARYDAERDVFDISEILDGLFSALPERPGNLLDLGCGAGQPVARNFVDRGWQVTGVDSCPAMLELAARHVPEMRLIAADMRSLDLPSGEWDAITAIYSFFHVPSVDHPKLLQNIRRWLKPGGLALFTYATPAYTGAEQFDGYIEFMGQSLFYSHESRSELVDHVRQAGFSTWELNERSVAGETFLWVTAKAPG